MRKKKNVLCFFMVLICGFTYADDYNLYEFDFGTSIIQVQLAEKYRPSNATTNYASFRSQNASITFSYISFINFTKVHPMDKGILGLASGTLLETIKTNPYISSDELLEELYKPNSKFLDIDLMYDATSSSKVVKFNSGLGGISFFTISRDEGDLMSNLNFCYVLILDKGLLVITVFPYVEKKELLEKLKNGGFGKTRIKSDGEFIKEEGQEQIDRIYEAIKIKELDIENIYLSYLDYVDLQKNVDVKCTKRSYLK